MTAPLIVCVAPNGARRGKGDHPAIPLTAAEIAATARRCRDAGAAMIHLHVRDPDGGHLLDAGAYRTAIAAIRERAGSDMVIQVTTEAVGRYAPAEQMAMIRALRPEAASLALRELIADGAAEKQAAPFLAETVGAGMLPQYILYAPEEISRLADLAGRGIVPARALNVLFVIGRHGAEIDPLGVLGRFVAAWEQSGLVGTWMVCAFGPAEAPCAEAAIALGGHVRVGFENNLHLPDGRLAPDNAALIEAVASLADTRPLADGAMARKLLAHHQD